MGLPAARVGDPHLCPMFDGPKPHVGGPILPVGVPTVLIGGMPAATVGTLCTCASAPDVIIKGSFTVLIGGRPAARQFDQTAHGGMILMGCPTVLIGDFGMGQVSTVNVGTFTPARDMTGASEKTIRLPAQVPPVSGGGGGSSGGGGGMAGISDASLGELMQSMPDAMANSLNQAVTLAKAAETGAPTAAMCKI